MTASIGVDLGGTKILAVLAEGDTVLAETTRQTPTRTSPPRVVEDVLCDAIEELLARVPGPHPVGIAAAGFVDRTCSRVMFAPHVSWRGEPVAERLTARLAASLPGRVQGRVVLDNDANAALWAERRFGLARTHDEAVLVGLGTGLGGAVLMGGQIYRGANGMAGEFGHVQVVPEGRDCPCGNQGCWEQYCSGSALNVAAAEAGSSYRGTDLITAARAGDPAAQAAYAEVGRWLGIGVAGVVAALDPSLVLVGGGITAAGDLLLDPAREALRGALVGRGHRIEPLLQAATLGPAAGAIGAGDLARIAVSVDSPSV